MCNFDNYSHEYKTRRILDLDKILLHVAQAKQAKHGSLVDRGANGSLAGSDVRILSTSSRKCTVTGIDNHEIP